MRLRKLMSKDAPLMLEWMHNPDVVKDLQANFKEKTIDDCYLFIEKSLVDERNVHLAIVDDSDEYLGTVSLKNIEAGCAEFAITIRSCAMGKGISKAAMEQIIELGFRNFDLNSIYWCVSPENVRAVKFYDKNGYKRIDPKDLMIYGYSSEQISHYLWYVVLNQPEF